MSQQTEPPDTPEAAGSPAPEALGEAAPAVDRDAVVVSPSTPPRRRRRWPVAIAGVLLGLVLVAVAGLAVARPWAPPVPSCAPAAHPEWSVARRWDEALLDAIRRALPAPTVHARNLYHTSAAMWDAWAAYDPTAKGVFFHEKLTAGDVTAARNTAISYAAFRVLTERYQKSYGGEASLSEFDDVMDALCLPIDDTSAVGNSPAAVGNRIAQAVLSATINDGSNEANGYATPDYKPVNPPLVVASPGITMTDPNRWQPLQIAHMIAQNGIPVVNGVQQNVGPNWGHVTGFGLPSVGAVGTPIDPGPPPMLGDPATDAVYKAAAIEVLRLSSLLDPAQNVMVDISPASIGDNTLGKNDGSGRPVNPSTGQPYVPNIVNQADFGRALAEFWADGPNSETPPGHWNVLANDVSDKLAPNLQIRGTGPVLDRLQWDVKLYLAVNGAVHDAAIAAWGLKGYYDAVRPISMIRYLASQGQSSDPSLPHYSKVGIPLVPGLVELITRDQTGPGGKFASLKGHEGEIAVYAWKGTPKNQKTEVSGVGWILGTSWVPYQLPTFVTPSFPGYISGHSTFSRAAAEVLTGFTGSPYFPGGMADYRIAAGSLKFEAGPSTDVVLQWATYFDASDQAGRSRLWGGIHTTPDDFTGRQVGAECGQIAWALAQRYYDGTAGS